MYLRSAARGFLAFLLLVSALHGYHDWTVTYTSSEVCALRGSTVEISCAYEYPDRQQYHSTPVETLWFTEEDHSQPGGLISDTDYAGRVEYSCEEPSCSLSSCSGKCTLRIRDLRQSDSAEYKVRFIINQPGGEYTGDPGVKLTVTDLTVKYPSTFLFWRKLECQSMCVLSDHPNYVWYKNGQHAQRGMMSIKKGDSLSCAVVGFERFHSPLVCFRGKQNHCNRVTYSNRTMCALQGTSVDISCKYSRGLIPKEEYWYAWTNNNEPTDLQEDSEYKGRVQYPVKEKGHSTLKITDLSEADSAEYRFKYKSKDHEWKSALHGTTLTVTGLRVELAAVDPVTEGQRVTLSCSTRCLLPGKTSYMWYQNKDPVARPESTENKLVLDPVSLQHAGNYSCSVSDYQHLRSPEETLTVSYAPKTTSVTVSPSGEKEDGSSVTLCCSSEAKPEAHYTWFKELEDSVEEPGQNYTTTNITSDLGETATPSLLTAVALGTSAVLLTIIALLVVLWRRRKMASGKASDTTEALPVYENASALTNHPAPAAQRESIERQAELHYGDIQHPHHSEMQEVPRCLAGSLVQLDQTHQVVYSGVNLNRPDAVLELTVLSVTAPSGLSQ